MGDQKIEGFFFLHTLCTVHGAAWLRLLSATHVGWCTLPLASSLPTRAAEGSGDVGTVQLVAMAPAAGGRCCPSASPFAAWPAEAGRGRDHGARSRPIPPAPQNATP